MTLVLVLVSLLALYQVTVAVIVQVGAARSRLRRIATDAPPAPSASLLVPARDEEARLPALLHSLEPQLDSFADVVFVNDRSSDTTGVLLDAFADAHRETVTVVHLTTAQPGPSPKLEAMKAGLPHITGDVLLMTDADCVVPPGWAARIIAEFRDADVGLVMAPVVAKRTGRLLSAYSISEHVYRYIGAAGLAGLGIPAGGFGNNMAVRVETLAEVGGFSAASVSVTEDAALVDLVADHSSRKVVSLLGSDALVETEPVSRWSEMARQLLRWQVGAIQSPDFISRLGMSLLNLGYLATVVLSFLSFWNPALLIGPAGTVVGASIMYIGGGRFLRQGLRYWLLVPVNLIVMTFANAVTGVIAATNPRLDWKGSIVRGSRRSGR